MKKMKTKRRSPRQHIRKMKSGKRIIVSKGNKGRPVIRKGMRKVFNHLSDHRQYNDEFGGAIDFDKKGRLEQVHLEKGKGGQIELPADYEVQWHTHPYKAINGHSGPSPEDIQAIIDNPEQQAELIFTDGTAYTLIKTQKTKALSRLPATTLSRRLDKAFLLSSNEKEWLNYLQKLGFNISINKKKKQDLYINVRPVN